MLPALPVLLTSAYSFFFKELLTKKINQNISPGSTLAGEKRRAFTPCLLAPPLFSNGSRRLRGRIAMESAFESSCLAPNQATADFSRVGHVLFSSMFTLFLPAFYLTFRIKGNQLRDFLTAGRFSYSQSRSYGGFFLLNKQRKPDTDFHKPIFSVRIVVVRFSND